MKLLSCNASSTGNLDLHYSDYNFESSHNNLNHHNKFFRQNRPGVGLANGNLMISGYTLGQNCQNSVSKDVSKAQSRTNSVSKLPKAEEKSQFFASKDPFSAEDEIYRSRINTMSVAFPIEAESCT